MPEVVYMPTLPLLIKDEGLLAIATRAAGMSPGVLLATGQARSGKVTTLMALAQTLATASESVALLSDRADAFSPFHGRPDAWKEITVEPSASAWAIAFKSPQVALSPVVVVAAVNRENAGAVFAARAGQWVLAALDTPLIGLDTAYALHEMGIDNATFAATVRAVWSQFLVDALCPSCARPAALSPAEMDHLFPTEPLLEDPKVEVGCIACEGRGTQGSQAVCEVVLIDDATRAGVDRALVEGMPPELPANSHVTAQDTARRMVGKGVIGIGTYRNAIRRNPLLRAQNQLEREQSRAFRLDVASKHKSAFLANMSHELRTPLNAIIGFSEVMQSGMAGPISDKQKEFVGDIHESGKHLLALINDILDLSKIEAGKMDLAVSRFDLPLTIDNAMTVVRGRAERQGVQLTARVAPDVSVCDADERKVKQILLNLLTNAVKFTPPGGTVTLAASRGADAYEVSVKDTGIGMNQEDLGRIFEDFQQVGKAHAGKAEGTGLGLSLTRRLVELHGGTIRVASAPGQGSTFIFTLPFAS